jgi:hypothetical protein
MEARATTQINIIYPMVAKYNPDIFQKWLAKVSEENGNLGVRALADFAGVSHPVIVDINNGLQPSEKTCVALALASGYSVEYVLQIGGYWPAKRAGVSAARQNLYVEIEKDDTSEALVEETRDYVRLRKKIEAQRGKDSPGKRDTGLRNKRDS